MDGLAGISLEELLLIVDSREEEFEEDGDGVPGIKETCTGEWSGDTFEKKKSAFSDENKERSKRRKYEKVKKNAQKDRCIKKIRKKCIRVVIFPNE